MSRQCGFSLLELLCVLAILSILAHAGSAQFLSVSQNTKDKSTLKNEMKRLADALTQARQLAVISGQTSFLCGGQNCKHPVVVFNDKPYKPLFKAGFGYFK